MFNLNTGLLADVLKKFEILNVEYDANRKIFEIECFEAQSDVDLNEDGMGGSTDFEINLYELMSKYKRWAIDTHSLMLSSSLTYNNDGLCEVTIRGQSLSYTNGKNEPDAVFQACELIYERKK